MTDPTTSSSMTSGDDLSIPLTRAVIAYGQEISRLMLRKPTSGDLIDLGQPMRLLPGIGTDETAIDVRMNVVAQYIVRLAAVPMSTVRSLELADLSAATQKVLGFFGDGNTPADAPASTTASTSPSASSS